MKCQRLASLLLVTVVLGYLAIPCPAAEKATRPNVIYIMSDDHASHAISCYGSKINKTPNLDRLADEGMLFRNAFCTNSICGPCRAVVLTGKYSHLNGFVRNGNTFDGSQQTVAKLLQGAGYQTAMVGKWHLKSEPTGFDYWHILIGQGPYYNPPMKTPEGTVKHTGYTTDIITDAALDFLKNSRDKDKPFFLMYHHKAPHRNWQPGPKYLNLYDDVTIPEPDNLFDDYSGRGTPAGHQEMTVAKHLNANDLKLVPNRSLNDEQAAVWNKAYGPKNKAFEEANLEGDDLIRWKYQRYIKDYLRCIASVDENVGRLLDYLDESGLAKNTIVIYTSDQGFYLGDHGWFDKRFMYEESLRSPLMVRWPGHVKPGSVSEELVLNLDFAETFLDAADKEIPADMQGESLVPVLEGNTPDDWRKAVYYRYYEYPAVHMVHKHYGVRTARHKLIFFHEIDEWELFDLQKDPREMKSVYADPAYAGVVAELKTELQRLRKQYKDDDTVRGQPAKRPVRSGARSKKQ
ncbi:MAG: sulfatase [Candidatus Nealsonbacteria bacterium]|nr:sulfatase [Candidatus Nealsonbacteria bacterium]